MRGTLNAARIKRENHRKKFKYVHRIGFPGPTIRVEFFNEKLTLEILQYSNLLSWSVKGKYIKVSLNQRSCFWVLKTTSTLI